MAGRTQRDHDDRALVLARGIADATTVAVSLQDRFATAAEILLILPLDRVAGDAQFQGQNFVAPGRTVHKSLGEARHFPAALAAIPNCVFARPM